MIGKRTGRMLVLGFGTSGIAATRLLLRQGWKVTVADERADAGGSAHAGLLSGAAVEFVHGPDPSVGYDGAVVSPGIPARHPWLARLREAGIPVVPEFEFGMAAMPGVRTVAVTGSNGKSSLVKWLADTLVLAGADAVPAGNYGMPPSALAMQERAPGIAVLELSSFQLEQAVAFRPDVAVLLNLTPNHLDRHTDYAEYAAAKARLFANLGPDDLAVVHTPAWPDIAGRMPPGVTPLLFGEAETDAAWFDGRRVCLSGRSETINLEGTWWGRYPQGVNAAAGVLVLDRLALPGETIRRAAETFQPLPHRFEEVTVRNGVAYVDDSKASTLSALKAAIASGTARKHLIAGGILKEPDVSFVKENLAKHCAFVYCIGTVADHLAREWNDVVPCEVCGDLKTAVARAAARAKPGEMVLLSPGCSSFDQFTGYAQRGETFKKLVRACTGICEDNTTSRE